jgi:SAM-dependent methyltransferase
VSGGVGDPAGTAKTGRYERHYASGGFGYDARRAQWTTWAWRHYVRTFKLGPLVPLPGRRPTVLDIPCGDGFWTSVLASLGFDAQGIDLSPTGVAQARKRYPRLTFHEGNAEEALPVPERSFDVVFSRAITHLHRSDLTEPATLKMASNLMSYVKDDGQLLVSFFTKRDGGGTGRHHYHPVSDLVRLFEHAGDVWRVDVVDNFVQIGVRHRDVVRRQRWEERAVKQALAIRNRFTRGGLPRQV